MLELNVKLHVLASIALLIENKMWLSFISRSTYYLNLSAKYMKVYLHFFLLRAPICFI